MFYRIAGMTISFMLSVFVTVMLVLFCVEENDLYRLFSIYTTNVVNDILCVSWLLYCLNNKYALGWIHFNKGLHGLSWLSALFYIVYEFGFSKNPDFKNPLDVMCQISVLLHPMILCFDFQNNRDMIIN